MSYERVLDLSRNVPTQRNHHFIVLDQRNVKIIVSSVHHLLCERHSEMNG